MMIVHLNARREVVALSGLLTVFGSLAIRSACVMSAEGSLKIFKAIFQWFVQIARYQVKPSVKSIVRKFHR